VEGGLDVLESLMDARWMHSTKIPMPAAIPQAVVASRPLSPTRSPNRPRYLPACKICVAGYLLATCGYCCEGLQLVLFPE
jgi:hypothetical protein